MPEANVVSKITRESLVESGLVGKVVRVDTAADIYHGRIFLLVGDKEMLVGQRKEHVRIAIKDLQSVSELISTYLSDWWIDPITQEKVHVRG